MMIAMKFYLLLSFFFAAYMQNPAIGLAQETSSEHISPSHESSAKEQPSEPHNESEFHQFIEPHTLPDSLKDKVENETDTFQAKFFNMLFILALLIGFMILASWALKQLMKSKITNLNTASNIKILETRYLSPRATLYLVEIQDKAFLIAESPTAVTYLATLPHEEVQ